MIFLISKYIRKEDEKTVLNCGTVGVICLRINYAVVVFPIIPWLVCNRISDHSTKIFTIIQAFDTTRLYHLSPRHETFLLADTISAGPPFWKSSNWEKQKNLPRGRKTFALSYLLYLVWLAACYDGLPDTDGRRLCNVQCISSANCKVIICNIIDCHFVEYVYRMANTPLKVFSLAPSGYYPLGWSDLLKTNWVLFMLGLIVL